jgi:hypothetical protein
MDHGVEVSVKPLRRRKSVADVQSILNRSRQQGSAGGTALHAIIEEAPPLRTPLSVATDANAQMTNVTRATEIPKKPHRRSSTAGISVEGSEKEKKPLSQVRSFMEVSLPGAMRALSHCINFRIHLPCRTQPGAPKLL